MSKDGIQYRHCTIEQPFDTVYLIVAVLIVILTVIEVIFLLQEMKEETHKSQIYLCNLALSDLIMGVCVLALSALCQLYNPEDNRHHHWILPLQIYLIIGGVRFSLVMSILSLAALTMDRFLAIIHPFFHRKITNRHAAIFLFFDMDYLPITMFLSCRIYQ